MVEVIALDPHPDNTTLLDTLAAIGHLPLRSVGWVRNGETGRVELTVALPTCGTYVEAHRLLGATTKGERDHITGSGARHREAEWGHGVVSHVCFPHLDCWEKP